jgi:hypothetical protein
MDSDEEIATQDRRRVQQGLRRLAPLAGENLVDMIDSFGAWRIRMGYNNDGGDNDERNDGNSGGSNSSSSSSSGGELPDIIDYSEMGGLEEDPSVTVYSDAEWDSMSSESDDWVQSFNVSDDDTELSQLTPEE